MTGPIGNQPQGQGPSPLDRSGLQGPQPKAGEPKASVSVESLSSPASPPSTPKASVQVNEVGAGKTRQEAAKARYQKLETLHAVTAGIHAFSKIVSPMLIGGGIGAMAVGIPLTAAYGAGAAPIAAGAAALVAGAGLYVLTYSLHKGVEKLSAKAAEEAGIPEGERFFDEKPEQANPPLVPGHEEPGRDQGWTKSGRLPGPGIPDPKAPASRGASPAASPGISGAPRPKENEEDDFEAGLRADAPPPPSEAESSGAARRKKQVRFADAQHDLFGTMAKQTAKKADEPANFQDNPIYEEGYGGRDDVFDRPS